MSDSGQPVPPGWLPAPGDPSRLRYWDGTQWTDQYAAVQAAPSPPGQPVAPVPPRKKPASEKFAQWFNPKPVWVRALLIIGALAVGIGGGVAWSIQSEKDDPAERDSGGGGSSSITVSVDKCTFDSDGWLEAGGFVTNRGDTAAMVVVNLLVDGKYVDRDVVIDVGGGGDKTSWSVSEPDTVRGTCTAEVD